MDTHLEHEIVTRDASIVDQNVQTAHFKDNFFNQILDLILVANIHNPANRRDTKLGSNLLCSLCDGLLVKVQLYVRYITRNNRTLVPLRLEDGT